jgi:hypothetical protein
MLPVHKHAWRNVDTLLLIVRQNDCVRINTVLFSLFRSLQLLSLNDAKVQPSFAKMIIHTLLESSCSLQTLDISENNVGSHGNISFFKICVLDCK